MIVRWISDTLVWGKNAEKYFDNLYIYFRSIQMWNIPHFYFYQYRNVTRSSFFPIRGDNHVRMGILVVGNKDFT